MASEALTLSPAELAVIFQHLIGGDADSQRTLSVDMESDEDQLEAARRSLRGRGLLMGDSRRRDTALSPSLEPILRTVTAPEVLGILQVSRPGATPKVTYISWSEGLTIANWIDEDGQHVIEPLASLEVVGDAVVRWTDITRYKSSKGTEEIEPEAIVGAASQRAVFMAVGGMQEEEQRPQAVSWLTSGDRLWLMDGKGDGQEPVIHPASASDVRKKIQSLMLAATSEKAAGARSVS